MAKAEEDKKNAKKKAVKNKKDKKTNEKADNKANEEVIAFIEILKLTD